jgi:hypothetical protein
MPYQQKNHPIHRLNNTLVLAKFLYYLCLTFYGKKVVIWTMNQLLAGSAFDEQIQENLNKSVFGFGALSQQFLGSDYITTKEMPYFLQKKSLFRFAKG